MRIGVLTSHPIQYQVPLFRELAARCDLSVYFAYQQTAKGQAVAGYEVEFEWDIDLFSGYSSQFLKNCARHADVFHFNGCDTPGVAEIVRNGHFDLFIVTGWYLKSYWQAVRACRRYRVPVVVRGDSQLGTERSLLKRTVKAVAYPCLLRQFDGFLYVGRRNFEYLLHYGTKSEQCFFSPHFIDTDRFRRQSVLTSETRLAVRQSCRVMPNEIMILSVGRLVDFKQPFDLLAAGKIMRESGIPVHVVYVGSGPLRDALQQQGIKLGVPCTLAGFKNQTELPALYACADVFALPSSSETWGMVVNEAMACSTPAVVSDAAGCAPDMIVQGETGAVFPVGNAGQLAASLVEVSQWKKTGRCHQALQDKCRAYSVQRAADGVMALARYFYKGI
ncbi:MAG: glycosyltransferase [Candidatus Electrothrix sp. AUS1_2]|nr:glycosyltransferase [Candidatus Electrothrix sp. AUS1_2]